MDYRYDLLQWRRKETGHKYEEIATAAGLSINAIWKTVLGKTDPSASTLKRTFKAMGLDPMFAFDFTLRKADFRRAVLGNGNEVFLIDKRP